ncbi:MAG TPA: helix-turn-helix domain-containing protein [Gemmatimonadaceae bacterium]
MPLADAPRRFFEGEQPPPEPFAEHVLARWTIDVALPAGEMALHTLWPDGCVSLFVVANAGAPVAASMVGPRLRALRVPVRGGLVLRGIRLWPDTAAQVLGVDPVAVRDLMRPAAEVLGVGALALARALARASDDVALEQVWTEWLAPRIESAALPDPDVRYVVRRLIDSEGRYDIAQAATEAGLSRRALDRRFGAAVGLTPTQFARIRRVRAAIGSVFSGARDVGAMAEHAGHADAVSFAREFRSVAGLSPQLLMREVDQLEH